MDRGTLLSELEGRTAHLQSRLSAFEDSSESEVVRRLQSEVADLEKVIRSRNLDIQILERRVRGVCVCVGGGGGGGRYWVLVGIDGIIEGIKYCV